MNYYPQTPYNYSSHTMAAYQPAPQNNKFIAYFQEGRIYTETSGGTQCVGVSDEIYQKVEKQAAEYEAELIKLGVIQVPLTQAQVNEKLMDELRAERESRTRLMSLVDELTKAIKVPVEMPVTKEEVVKNVGYENPVLRSDDRDVTDDSVPLSGVGEGESVRSSYP